MTTEAFIAWIMPLDWVYYGAAAEAAALTAQKCSADIRGAHGDDW